MSGYTASALEQEWLGRSRLATPARRGCSLFTMSMKCFLFFDLLPTPVGGDLREKDTHLARRLGSLRGLVFPQRGSATIRIPLMSKYDARVDTAWRACQDVLTILASP